MAAALAYVFPPTIFLPPEIDTEQQAAPGAPLAPPASLDPNRPQGEDGQAARAAVPATVETPGSETAPDVAGLLPPPAPEVFDATRAPMLTTPAGRLLPDTPAAPGAVGGAMHPAAAPVLAERPAGDGGPDIDARSPGRPAIFDAAVPPAAPTTPARVEDPIAPDAGTAQPQAVAPPAADRPDVERTPGIGSLAPLPAPTIFDGGGAGAPSLVTPE